MLDCNIILFLVGLQSVPKSLYEAASIEGASKWQQFKWITIPAINPTIFMVVILSTIGGFSLFIEPYVMTGGGPLNSTLSTVLYMYKQGFFYYHMGYAATLGLVFALLILFVVFLQRTFIEKKQGMRKIILYSILVAASLAFLYPFLWMISASLSEERQH
jgi:ABC-type sugar transport system permease subunit